MDLEISRCCDMVVWIDMLCVQLNDAAVLRKMTVSLVNIIVITVVYVIIILDDALYITIIK